MNDYQIRLERQHKIQMEKFQTTIAFALNLIRVNPNTYYVQGYIDSLIGSEIITDRLHNELNLLLRAREGEGEAHEGN